MKPNMFAAKLNGADVDYLSRRTDEEAEAAGLVIVYGASNEMVVLAGAISGEVDIPEGGTIFFDGDGVLPDADDVAEEDSQAYYDRKRFAFVIEAERSKDGFSWAFAMASPHSRFMMQKNGDKYCRGIVFSLASVGI